MLETLSTTAQNTDITLSRQSRLTLMFNLYTFSSRSPGASNASKKRRPPEEPSTCTQVSI